MNNFEPITANTPEGFYLNIGEARQLIHVGERLTDEEYAAIPTMPGYEVVSVTDMAGPGVQKGRFWSVIYVYFAPEPKALQ